MALSEDFLYALKRANDIENVMSSYVTLKKRGHTSVCLCPFHSEKTPSCVAYSDGQNFYCYGCHAGGDVITFIMKVENLSYIEAVRFLAERAGMEVPDDRQNLQDNYNAILKKKVYEMNRLAAKFFYNQLKTVEGKTALAYLLNRGLLPETIKKYGLGYAKNSWGELKAHLLQAGFSQKEIVLSGLCANGKNDRVYDVFRNRVMFPIIDLRGNIIAFGGRKLDNADESSPKYVNTSDTPVFKKSKNLFSLNFAKTQIKENIILAEGYMDVIAINQAGFENVVATLGTALTPEQSRIIAGYAKKVVVAYDSDEAGQKATHKAISLLGEVGVETRVLRMDGAKDPDEYIKKFGKDRFKLLLDKSKGAVDYELDKCKIGLNIENEIDKVEYLKKAKVVLSNIYSPIERDVYISKVASENNISKDALATEVNFLVAKKKKSDEKKSWRKIEADVRGNSYRSVENDGVNKRVNSAEKSLIAYILKYPDRAENVLNKLNSERITTPFYKKFYQFYENLHKNNILFDFSYVNSEFSLDEVGIINEIVVKNKEISYSEESVDDFIKIILDYNEKSNLKGDEFSDDDLTNFVNSLKNKK